MLAATSVAYATESLTEDLWDELQPLLEANALEIEHFTSDLPLDPNREAYGRLQELGSLKVYSARVDPPAPDRGRLIGYMAVFISRSLHQQTLLLASLDALFVDRSWRGGSVGRDLLRFAQDDLRQCGVTAFYSHVKQRSDIAVGPLLARMGYRCVDAVWAIRLDKEPAHG